MSPAMFSKKVTYCLILATGKRGYQPNLVRKRIFTALVMFSMMTQADSVLRIVQFNFFKFL